MQFDRLAVNHFRRSNCGEVNSRYQFHLRLLRFIVPHMMIAINMFRGAMFLALFVCTAGEPSSRCGMPDNGNVNVRFFLTCTCQELKCNLAREMGKYVDLPVIIWNFGLEACSQCISICRNVAKTVHNIHDRKNRANRAARRCLEKKYFICVDVVRKTGDIPDHKNPAKGAVNRCLTEDLGTIK